MGKRPKSTTPAEPLETLELDADLRNKPADALLAEEQIMRERAERVRREIRMNRAYIPPSDGAKPQADAEG